ncbi:MAG: hypothetical protein WCP28_06760 [Actinomycetes bacterium]
MLNTGPGSNYFDALGGVHTDDESAAKAVAGLRSVPEGAGRSYSMEYPCDSRTEKRWFIMNVGLVDEGQFGAVVSHVEITAWRKGQGANA